ncbi:MAG: pyrroline-5-carboxylate reductase [Lachnospiraceae bacterium]|nr:pyrroline-5-carboxylate reductase [Lachnospiraceae bacterium]
MAKIGFIGVGNMGYAMMRGILKNFSKDDILFTDVNTKRCAEVSNELGVEYVHSNAELANNAKYVVLAVKPQFYDAVTKNIRDIVTENTVIISLAPGISIEDVKFKVGSSAKIVRVMPNTPALIGEGMTGICYENNNILSPEEKETVEKIFSSIGNFKVVDEKIMSAVVCASGSSPAYVYMFIEALADSVVKYGMPRDMAYDFVANTVVGAAKMVKETGLHPGKLKDAVCSPGGTTIAGVAALEEFGFRNSIIKATDACYDKCENMK